MKKRSRDNGYVDPYQPRRSNHRLGGKRTATIPFSNKDGIKNCVETTRELAAINKEYKDKEYAVSSAQGPHSLPEQHYEKSFFIKPKKEEEE